VILSDEAYRPSQPPPRPSSEAPAQPVDAASMPAPRIRKEEPPPRPAAVVPAPAVRDRKEEASPAEIPAKPEVAVELDAEATTLDGDEAELDESVVAKAPAAPPPAALPPAEPVGEGFFGPMGEEEGAPAPAATGEGERVVLSGFLDALVQAESIERPAPPPAADDAPDPFRAAVHEDSVPSVISIPEDEVPRGPVGEDAVTIEGDAGVEEVSAASEERPAPPPPPRPAARGAGEAPPPRPAAPPRPGKQPQRKRRRRGRRAWWEELFDDEYIRSLPRYTSEQARAEADFVERALGLQRGARVLDLACGPGRQAVELASRGYEVVALDLSLPMLARAGDTAQERGTKLNFIQGDMRELQFETSFDGVYNVGTSFGYFDDETNAKVLQGVFRALKPGGRFLLEMCNRDYILRGNPNATWFEGDDRQFLEETDFNYLTSRLVVKRSWATADAEQEAVEYSIRLFSLHEMGQILHQNRFRVIEVSGCAATPGVFFGCESPKIIVVAEKP
jgi:SAM-dependent methyltransferase